MKDTIEIELGHTLLENYKILKKITHGISFQDYFLRQHFALKSIKMNKRTYININITNREILLN